MRVAFLSASDQMGGSEVMLLELMVQLRVAYPSWPLHLVVPGPGPLATRASERGVEVTILPMPPGLRRVGEWGSRGVSRARRVLRLARAAAGVPGYRRRLARVIARIAPDVIHSNSLKSHIVAARLPRGSAALVWHVHEYVSAKPLTARLLRRHARRCDTTIANSRSVADDLRRVHAAAASSQVIYNAVDLTRFRPDGPSADLDGLAGLPSAPAGTIRIGLVATLSRWKGHETFLQAVGSLPASIPVRAYIVGSALYDTDGSQYSVPELRRMAESLGVERRLGFTGFVEAPEAVMRALDVVVHASTEPEAFGLVIAEAMACGRALTTSGIGGAAEIVRDGEDALIHRAGDAPHLAARLTELAEDAALRERLGAAAHEAAVRRFDARRLAAEFAAAYERACAHQASA